MVTDWTLADALGMRNRPNAGVTQFHRVFVRDLVVACGIGVYDYEHGIKQRVRVNAELLVETGLGGSDRLDAVLNYESVVEGVRAIAAGEHINLVETLAERVVGLCFADARVRAVRVAVEKLDVYPDAGSVGVVVTRRRRMPAAR